jgi:DNA-binding NarL/FixJ family response regulator
MCRIMYRGIEVQCDLIDEAVGLCDRLGVPWDTGAPRGAGHRRYSANTERDAEIVRLSKSGVNMRDIAKQFGLSEGRIPQIVKRHQNLEHAPLLTEEQEQGA